MEISTTSQPRAKRKLDRAQPQEEGRHRSCAAPLREAALYRACASRGASAECQSKTTGSRPWLKLYRRSAAKSPRLISSLSLRLLRRLFSLRGELQRACYTGRNSLRDRHARIADLWFSSSEALRTKAWSRWIRRRR